MQMSQRHSDYPRRPTVANADKADVIDFNPITDAWNGAREAYRIIRARKAAGGLGWAPRDEEGHHG
jgi:hypothetical protein